MGHSSPNFRKEVAWSLSNILAAGEGILEQIINHEIFNRIISHLNIDDFKVWLHIKKIFIEKIS